MNGGLKYFFENNTTTIDIAAATKQRGRGSEKPFVWQKDSDNALMRFVL